MAKGSGKRDVRITLRLTMELHAAIKEAADEDRRSMSDWLVLAAEAALAQRSRPPKRS
ncbi:MAG: DUF1778 domain-containing protein [Kofleriaceae bacterium]